MPIDSAPVEILCHIFHFICDNPIRVSDLHCRDGFPWEVGRVCKHWRHAFLSHPPLWASLFLSDYDAISTTTYLDKVNRRMTAYLERSKDHPLDIDVRLHRESPIRLNAWRILLSHSHRWKVARLYFQEQSLLDSLLAFQGNFPILESLTLATHLRLPNPSTAFEVAPRLAHIKLDNGPKSFALPWSQLKKMQVTSWSKDRHKIFAILQSLEKIEELEWVHASSGDSFSTLHHTPARLSLLRILTVNLPVMLACIEAPLLQELRLMGFSHCHNSYQQEVQNLILRSSCRVLRLSLFGLWGGQGVLSLSDDIEELQLFPSGDLDCHASILLALADVRNRACLPNLRVLGIECPISTNEGELPVLAEAMVKLVASRGAHSSNKAFSACTVSLKELIIRFPSVAKFAIPRVLLNVMARWTVGTRIVVQIVHLHSKCIIQSASSQSPLPIPKGGRGFDETGEEVDAN